uniref:Uncharacterized protein n=1 Tax=Micrurus spixii TaxID=129469 RepID=A0A2D4NM86_9SAUR
MRARTGFESPEKALCRSICAFQVSVFPSCELGYRYTQYGAFNSGWFVVLDEPGEQLTLSSHLRISKNKVGFDQEVLGRMEIFQPPQREALRVLSSVSLFCLGSDSN